MLFVRGGMCCLLEVVCVVCYRRYVLFVTGGMCCFFEAICVVY